MKVKDSRITAATSSGMAWVSLAIDGIGREAMRAGTWPYTFDMAEKSSSSFKVWSSFESVSALKRCLL